VKRTIVKTRIADEPIYLRPERDGIFLVYRVARSAGILVDGRFALVLADYIANEPVTRHPFFPYFVATLRSLGLELTDELVPASE
jgi:hypothetical protein